MKPQFLSLVLKSKIVKVLFTIIILGQLFALPIHAQVNNPQIQSNNTQMSIMNFSAAIICQLSGYNPITQKEDCLSPAIKNGKLTYTPDHSYGVIGFLSRTMNSTFDIPVSSTDYIGYLHTSFGLSPKAYADGVGLNSIKSLVNIWIVFRNLCLTFFILISVVIGLMIMFRVKIDQRTVMSIENQLPKLVIVLILINFSFAIGGFLIDMMHVADNIVYNTLNQIYDIPDLNPITLINNNTTPLGALQNIDAGGALGLSSDISYRLSNDIGNLLGLSGAGSSIGQTVVTSLGSLLFWPGQVAIGLGNIAHGTSPFDQILNWISYGVADGLAQWLGQIVGDADILGTSGNLPAAYAARAGADLGVTLVVEPLIRGVGVNLFIIMLIFFGLVIAMVRLMFNLLTSYVAIIFNIILSPFFILFGIFPGSQINFSSWIKGLAADLLVFPATLGMFHLTRTISHALAGGVGFHPPFLPTTTDGASVAALFTYGGLIATAFLKGPIRAMFGLKDNKQLSQLFGLAFIGTTVLQKSLNGVKSIRGGVTRQVYNPATGQMEWQKVPGSALDAITGAL